MKTVEELVKEWGELSGGSPEQYIYDYLVEYYRLKLKEPLVDTGSKANIAATKYARFITGYLPADDERYESAYNHFKAGYLKAIEDSK